MMRVRRRHGAGQEAALIPVRIIILIAAAVSLVGIVVTMRLFSVSHEHLQSPRSFEGGARSYGIRKHPAHMPASASRVVRESQDLDTLDWTVSKSGRGPIKFAGSKTCRDRLSTESPCWLILPTDTNSKTTNDAGVFADLRKSISKQVSLQTWTGEKGGFGAPINQDRSVMVLLDGERTAPSFLLLLADGHGDGGEIVAEHVAKDLPFRLFRILEEIPDNHEQTVRNVLEKCFLETDELANALDTDGGSTLVVVLQVGDFLYLASAGDSVAILAEWTGSEASIISQAVRHKPADIDERSRIETAGGTVIQRLGDSSRVIIPDARGPLYDMALAMSRSMGDRQGKEAGFLVATPSIQVVSLADYRDKDLFVVASSDGVTDMVPIDPLLSMIGGTIFQERQTDMDIAVQTCLSLASSRWLETGPYRDDMTLTTTRL
jgi:serine/threonine protein phosphatase PrpC